MILDEEKILPYVFSMENTHPFDPPYIAFFQHNEKSLYFVVSAHIARITKAPITDHPTLKTIDHIYQHVQPELAIIEGIHTGDKVDAKSIAVAANKCRKIQYEIGCGESFYTINKTEDNYSHYVSGEPSEEEIKTSLINSHFSELDLLGFYVLRQIPTLKRQGEWSEVKRKKIIYNLLQKFSSQIGTHSTYGLSEFEKWYREHRVGLKNWNEINADDCAPYTGPDATYVQKISHQVGSIRDRFLLKRIQWALDNYKKIIVVYGGSHYLTLRKALENALGRPREVKKF